MAELQSTLNVLLGLISIFGIWNIQETTVRISFLTGSLIKYSVNIQYSQKGTTFPLTVINDLTWS